MKPPSRYVVEGFVCVIWTSLEPCRIDLESEFIKIPIIIFVRNKTLKLIATEGTFTLFFSPSLQVYYKKPFGFLCVMFIFSDTYTPEK